MKRGAVAVSLVAALSLVACAEGVDEAQVGDVVSGGPGDVSGDEFVVQVPTGQVRIIVGEPTEVLSKDDAGDGREHVAPPGSVWVPLDWRHDAGAGLTPFLRTVMTDDKPRTTVNVMIGNEELELGDAGSSTSTPADTRTTGRVHVALPAATPPVVMVDFDGVTSHVDTGTGEVGGEGVERLANLAEPVQGRCDDGKVAGGRAEVACLYTWARVPYLGGKGWSGAGWSVAHVETRVDEFEADGATYATSVTTDESELFGSGTSTSQVVTARLTSLVTQVVAEGPATPLQVVRVVEGTKVRGAGRDGGAVTYATRVPWPAG